MSFFAAGIPQDELPIDISSTDHDLAGKRVIGLRATGAGNIAVVTRAGGARTLAVAAGETRVLAVTKVVKTGTTATGIVALIG